MNLQHEDYLISYDTPSETVYFQGTLRLNGLPAYQPILNFLNEVINQNPSTLKLDVKKLDFLNSSGILMLSRFLLKFRQSSTIHFIMIASNSTPWQAQSLKNLSRLLPHLQLIFE